VNRNGRWPRRRRAAPEYPRAITFPLVCRKSMLGGHALSSGTMNCGPFLGERPPSRAHESPWRSAADINPYRPAPLVEGGPQSELTLPSARVRPPKPIGLVRRARRTCCRGPGAPISNPNGLDPVIRRSAHGLAARRWVGAEWAARTRPCRRRNRTRSGRFLDQAAPGARVRAWMPKPSVFGSDGAPCPLPLGPSSAQSYLRTALFRGL